MADVEVPWEVPDMMEPEESVRGMLKVIESKDYKDTGTFWTWDGRVSPMQGPFLLGANGRAATTMVRLYTYTSGFWTTKTVSIRYCQVD